MGDSHLGMVDVTTTWDASELEPFRNLISQGKVDVVMTAHIYNNNIDPGFPATLSRKTITDLLRGEMGFNGVVMTDDLYMEAVSTFNSLVGSSTRSTL